MNDEELQQECLTRISLATYRTIPSNLEPDQLSRIVFQAIDLFQLIKSRDQQIALAAQEKLLIEIAHDDEYKSGYMNFLISRNAIVKKLTEVRATLKQAQEKTQ